jgi:hypothetical protein
MGRKITDGDKSDLRAVEWPPDPDFLERRFGIADDIS